MIDADKVFNPKDFESIQLSIAFTNLTTRTEVKEKTKVRLLEVGEKQLIFELPSKTCNSKHSVMAVIKKVDRKSKKEKELLNVTGKILEVEDVGDNTLRVTVDCVQFDEKSWNEFMAFYSGRQNDIEKFFKATRGY